MSKLKSIKANLYNINILTKFNISNIYDEEKSLFYQSLIDTQPLYEGNDFFILSSKCNKKNINKFNIKKQKLDKNIIFNYILNISPKYSILMETFFDMIVTKYYLFDNDISNNIKDIISLLILIYRSKSFELFTELRLFIHNNKDTTKYKDFIVFIKHLLQLLCINI
jgi:hypothetical protein